MEVEWGGFLRWAGLFNWSIVRQRESGDRFCRTPKTLVYAFAFVLWVWILGAPSLQVYVNKLTYFLKLEQYVLIIGCLEIIEKHKVKVAFKNLESILEVIDPEQRSCFMFCKRKKNIYHKVIFITHIQNVSVKKL